MDLLLCSREDQPFVLAIEAKVAPDDPAALTKQLHLYRNPLNSPSFRTFPVRLLFLLTPFSLPHGANGHLSWDQVCDALEKVASAANRPEHGTLQQFANFLKIQHLAKMKLPSRPETLPALKTVAPLLAGLHSIFASLRNDEIGKELFRKQDVIPKMTVRAEEDYFWYGIWSHGTARPFHVIGVHSTLSGQDPLQFSIQIQLPKGAREIPKTLALSLNEKDSGPEAINQNYIFTRPLEGAFSTAPAIEECLNTLREIKQWVG